MSTPVVLRVAPIYERGRKQTLAKTAGHNARTDGDLRHVDSSRTPLNRVLMGTGNDVADVQAIAGGYPRSSNNGPIAGELILTASKNYFRDKSEAYKEQWAMDSLAWVIQEFGAERVAGCHWHRDEGAEHLHVPIVPIATTVIGNQHLKKTIIAINYSAVLGKPPGGESGLPPSERRWGKRQTGYAEFMASRGHNLIRGVRNRKIVNQAPHEWKKEVELFYEGLTQKFKAMPDDGSRAEFSKAEIAKFIVAQVAQKTRDWTGEKKTLLNQAEAVQQLLNDASRALGCLNPAQLGTYAADVQTGLKSRKWSCEKAAREGAEIRAKEAQKILEQQKYRSRSTAGQRKTKEERQAARAERRMEAERDARLNQITHQITQMPTEIGYARESRTTHGTFRPGPNHRV